MQDQQTTGILLEDVIIQEWETSPWESDTPGHREYRGIGTLPNGKVLEFYDTDAVTLEGDRILFTNPAQIQVGSRVKVMRFHEEDGDHENLIVVED